jgi:hypothetical protein
MRIHYYTWLYLENEEEVEVEETRTSSSPPPEEHQAGNCAKPIPAFPSLDLITSP